jgi:two-component system sensor histidine kinase KdpD
MLDDAHEKYRSGTDVVVGYVDPNTTPETVKMLDGLQTLPMKAIKNGNYQVMEFDLDAALERRPELILVDDLAHANAFGMRNKKRYQDIEELLNAGIDVYTTLNIQNLGEHE